MSIPHNIFERPVSIAKSKTIQYKKGPVRISAPSSRNNSGSPSSASSSDDDESSTNARTGDKRKSSSSSSSKHASSRKRRVDEDTEMRDTKQEEEDVKMSPSSFLEKVRQDKKRVSASKNRSAAAVSFSAPTNSTSSERTKVSISDYRASRGLPPAVSNRGAPPLPPQRQPSTGANSSLFINRRKPAAAVSHGSL